MKPIIPFLMFNNQAEEAARFYVSLFKNAEIRAINYYSQGEADFLETQFPKGKAPGAGDVKVVSFSINDEDFHACNGGPDFTFSMGFSMYTRCDSQAELDELWKKLSEDGKILECGWVTDKFGVCWQVVPADLDKWLNDPDEKRAERVSLQVYKMKKLDFAPLKRAYEGEPLMLSEHL